MINKTKRIEIVGIKETKKIVITGLEMFRKQLEQPEVSDNIGISLRDL